MRVCVGVDLGPRAFCDFWDLTGIDLTPSNPLDREECINIYICMIYSRTGEQQRRGAARGVEEAAEEKKTKRSKGGPSRHERRADLARDRDSFTSSNGHFYRARS